MIFGNGQAKSTEAGSVCSGLGRG